MSPNGAFKKYLKAIGDIPAAVTDVNHHLEDDALIAFQHNRLSIAERESADWHLKQCSPCAAKFEDVRDFFEPRYTGEKDWTEFEQRQTWRELRAKLPFENTQAVASHMPARKSVFFNSRAMYAVAAGLLLITSLTGLIAFRLYQEKQALQALLDQNRNEMVAKIGPAVRSVPAPEEKASILARPDEARVNTPIREITVYDTVHTTQNGKDVLVTTFPSKADYFAFTLDLVSDSFATYRIEFTDLDGKTILNQPNLRPNERANEKTADPRPNQNATLSVSIPRPSLKPGLYLFRIYGQRDGQSVLLEALTWSFK